MKEKNDKNNDEKSLSEIIEGEDISNVKNNDLEKMVKDIKTEPWIKRYLIRNKIYFETITATLLTIMAIVVSFGQLSESKQQNEVLKTQVETERMVESPNIIVTNEITLDENNNLTDSIELLNSGEPLTNLQVDDVVIFRATFSNGTIKHKSIYIFDYYVFRAINNNPVGYLGMIILPKNYMYYLNLEAALNELPDEVGFAYIEMMKYLKITYIDKFNQTHSIYFKVNHVDEGFLLPEHEGQLIFSEYDKAKNKGDFIESEEISVSDFTN